MTRAILALALAISGCASTPCESECARHYTFGDCQRICAMQVDFR